MKDWKVVNSLYLCRTKKKINELIAMLGLKDPIIEKYEFEKHCHIILKLP